jgi:hypothetical protein
MPQKQQLTTKKNSEIIFNKNLNINKNIYKKGIFKIKIRIYAYVFKLLIYKLTFFTTWLKKRCLMFFDFILKKVFIFRFILNKSFIMSKFV